MNTKHTPGPWKLINTEEENPIFPILILTENGKYGPSKLTINTSHDQSHDSILANARLISMAPDMLEMLTHVSERLNDLDNSSDSNDHLYWKTRAYDLCQKIDALIDQITT